MMVEPLVDSVLGELRYNAKLGWYDADVQWCGASASMSLSVEQVDDLPGAAATAKALLEGQTTWQARMMEAVVRDLLDLKNGEWFDPEHDAAPYTPETLVAPLTLEGATIFADGTATFFFEDGNLFFGHTILVAVDTASGDVTADLAG
ncbi:MAG: hypothetical protein B7Y45_12420 [Sphingomonas sp. 28-66-16]|nr:MAG: hypothetical protein B7Y45_12420 [Sphingomonas sp. 28-66-16]